MNMPRASIIMPVVLAVVALLWGIDQGRAQSLTPDQLQNLYFGGIPNYANSLLPTVDPTGAVVPGTGVRKFVNTLPGLNAPNDIGQQIPIAIPDVSTFPGSDYYEINLVEYSEQMHSDLPPTRLRGYVQANAPTPQQPHYLAPLIIGQKGRPVRIKFTNQLLTGPDGNLFIPVDTTIMGAGMGPDGMNGYLQNRATLHLHGGNTPWISDGTPHQWTVPAGDAPTTPYPKGVSTAYVPDMWFDASGNVVPTASLPPNPAAAGLKNDPGPGSMTFYYPNQQSGRLMFYHDHTYGITRLNVYAGEAAGYLLTDPVVDPPPTDPNYGTSLVGKGIIPADQVPLVIQDKTFVWGTPGTTRDPITGLLTGGTGTYAADPTWPDLVQDLGPGSLWLPHVYMPNQWPGNPDWSGANPMGRWDYGAWFWPPYLGLINQPLTASDGTQVPNIPRPSLVPEAFCDTPVVNGTAYPVLKVGQKAYRFRILNACNDRFLNLQLYYAKSNAPMWNLDGNGKPTTLADATAGEVPMVPAVVSTTPLVGPAGTVNTWPATWPTDNRDGGVPDPSYAGPPMIQIGTEGGLLPAPVVVPPTPVGYNYNRRDIVVLNVAVHALFLGPAERADVIIDFSGIPDGTKLILYNDAPAPVPAFDPRNDYYTGDPDLTAMGGAPKTEAGYGPNTRTIMQIQVDATLGTAPPFDQGALNAALPAAFAASQDTIIVPESAYGPAYAKTYTDKYARIQDTSLTYTPIDATGVPQPSTTAPLRPKAIQELFEPDYGRMNAILGVELPNTSATIQTTIPYYYVDPATELMQDGAVQLWKITHNGVDTHAIHFHLFTAQVINRMGWDGAIRPPDPNELGWKDTVRMNPLEDIVVATKPLKQQLGWPLPNSIRPLDVTMPLGTTMQFTGVDPAGNPVTIANQLINYGWEYVWHCHLLGHEENDMMRPIVFAVAPEAPANLTAALKGSAMILTWTDPSMSAMGFTVQRAADAGFTTGLTTQTIGKVTTYKDATYKSNGVPYYYRVFATSVVGGTPTGAKLPGAYTTLSTISAPSNVVGPPTGTTTITALTQAPGNNQPVVVTWTYLPGGDQTGFTIQRATDAAFTTGLTVFKVAGTVTSYSDKAVKAGVTYYYRVLASNPLGNGSWSAANSITTH